jgi:hypothetical protein
MKEEIKKEDLHFVGSFMSRNLYLETPDIGIVEMFNKYNDNQQAIVRLYQEIKTNQEMMKIYPLINKKLDNLA